MKLLKKLFGKKSPQNLQAEQLHDAELKLLEAECHAEYYEAMVLCMRGRVERLKGQDDVIQIG
jgi:hypothetical protein